MKNLFVPHKIAIKLKEKNFYEPCMKGVKDTEELTTCGFGINNHSTMHDFALPLYTQVIDWLESNHNLLIHRVMGFNKNHICYKLQDVKECTNIDTFQGEKALDEAILTALILI